MLRSAFPLRAGARGVVSSTLPKVQTRRPAAALTLFKKNDVSPTVARFSSAASKQFAKHASKSQEPAAEESVEDFEAFLKGEKAEVKPLFDPATEGIVVTSEKGVILVDGLEKAPVGAEIALESGHRAIVLSLLTGSVEAAVLDGKMSVPVETRARIAAAEPSVPVGRQLIGRVINPLGEPLDGKGPIVADTNWPILNPPFPKFFERTTPVPGHDLVSTGIKSIDLFRPLARGLNYGLFGPRDTGKTTLAIDAITQQKAQNELLDPKDRVCCVYVSVGQSQAHVNAVVHRLEKRGLMDFTIVVSATENNAHAMQYLAPFCGSTIASYLRDSGTHALIIYDDLTAHSLAFKRLTKALKYPTDSLVLAQSRLLERSTIRSEKIGGGSTTALCLASDLEPMQIELSRSEAAELTASVDDVLYTDPNLARARLYPAISLDSIIRANVSPFQSPCLRPLVTRIFEMVRESQEAADNFRVQRLLALDDEEEDSAIRDFAGKFQETLIQTRPSALSTQILLYYSVSEGYLHDVPPEEVSTYESKLRGFFEARYPDVMAALSALNLTAPFPTPLALLMDVALAKFHKENYGIPDRVMIGH